MKIIFICKYNAFRSKVAELYFKKLNKDSRIKVVSRGFIMGAGPDKVQVNVVKEILRIDITKVKQKPVNLWELVDADKIIVVANDIPIKMFDYRLKNLKKKVVIWRIKDEQRQNKKNIKSIILQIKRQIDKLDRSLK